MKRPVELIGVIDDRIEQKKEAAVQATVVAVNEMFATIRLNGSSAHKRATYNPNDKPSAGDGCLAYRVNVRGGKETYVIGTTFRTGSKKEPNRNPSWSSELAPPNNIEWSDVITGAILIQWDVPVQQVVSFEIEVSDDDEEEGDRYSTRGNHLIIPTTTQKYVRVRSVSAPPALERSNWSPWLICTPDLSVADLLSDFQMIEFSYLDASPKMIYTYDSGKYVTECYLAIETPFNGTVSLSVGELGNTSRLMSSAQNDPSVAGVYKTSPNYEYPGPTTANLYLSVTGASQGSGRVIIYTR